MSFEGLELHSVKVDLVENLSPKIVKNKPYTFDEDCLSGCYRLAQVLRSLPPLRDVETNLDLEVKCSYCDDCPSDGLHHTIIVYLDQATKRNLMLKKNLHPLYLKLFFLLQEFEFEVRDERETSVLESSFLSVFSLSKG